MAAKAARSCGGSPQPYLWGNYWRQAATKPISCWISLRLAKLSMGAPARRSKYVMDALRRDVSFVWHTVISVVFIAFAGLAVAAALLDLVSISR